MTSAKAGEGLEALMPWLTPGRTVALLGSSGVGKSTLVNRLLGREKQKTREVRAADQRGRHTTTHRELIALPGGALLLDTPGLREIQLWSDGAGFDAAFEDVSGLFASCRFTGLQPRERARLRGPCRGRGGASSTPRAWRAFASSGPRCAPWRSARTR